MEMDFHPLAQGSGGRGKAGQAEQPAPGREEFAGVGQHKAAFNFRDVQALRVDGATLARRHRVHGLAVALQAARAGGQVRRHEAGFIPGIDRAGNHRAGDHRAVALHAEHAVHGQAKDVAAAARGQLGRAIQDMGPERVQTLARGRGNGKDRRVFQKSALQEALDVFFDQGDPVRLDHVGFGQSHKAVADAQQGTDFQMLAGLGHDALVRGNDQHDEVHARRAGHHVFDEALMAGHVHNAQALAAGQIHPGEAELDGDAPTLFLAQTVAVDAGEGAHQGGLAVINMSGRAQYNSHVPLPPSPNMSERTYTGEYGIANETDTKKGECAGASP